MSDKAMRQAFGKSNLDDLIYGAPDPTTYHEYFNDFNTYTAGDWTITTTEAGGGSASEALGTVDGGTLVITNDSNDDDADFFQLNGEGFLFESGKKLRFKTRFKVSDATQSDFVMGLQITDTTPLDVTDGVFFIKADGSTSMTLQVEKDGTATSTTAATIADDTWLTAEFVYDGVAYVRIYINGVFVDQSVVTNLPDDEVLTVSFGIQNGEAAAKVMTIDYIHVVKER